MTFSTIQLHPGPRVTSIVLDRPPLNIINIQMMKDLAGAWKEIEGLGAQVIVVSAAGERAFSAGVDVADHVPDRLEEMLDRFHRVIRRFAETDCITIAAIHGHTLGGGAELAMVCDLIIAADDTEIGQPEIALGCYPPVAAAYLPRAIGFHKASEMVLLGESISALEAERIGLINKVVPKYDLGATVDAYVDRLLSKSSAALAVAKHALREGIDHRFDKALSRAEDLYVKQLAETEDMREGVQAFLEKRPPSWKNR